jgi:hypothetical protein
MWHKESGHDRDLPAEFRQVRGRIGELAGTKWAELRFG